MSETANSPASSPFEFEETTQPPIITPAPVLSTDSDMPEWVKEDLDEIHWNHAPITPTRTIRWLADALDKAQGERDELATILPVAGISYVRDGEAVA